MVLRLESWTDQEDPVEGDPGSVTISQPNLPHREAVRRRGGRRGREGHARTTRDGNRYRAADGTDGRQLGFYLWTA